MSERRQVMRRDETRPLIIKMFYVPRGQVGACCVSSGKAVNLELARVSVEGIFEYTSSAGWSTRTAVAAAQRSEAGLRLGYRALFCLQPANP